MKNWWYYHKWYVICDIFLLGIFCHLIRNALGFGQKTPDLQIAYIGKNILPQDTAAALEEAFASIASDFNNDGEIIVKVHQYINGAQNADLETAYYEYASELTLIGDISDCESYFFLMDDPDDFQKSYHLLADSNGDCPPETDYSTEDKVIRWSDCTLLAQTDLGSYSSILSGKEVSGKNQELLSNLFIGRRCFYTDQTTNSAADCSSLWDSLNE